jgi:hypothetical protein
MSDGWRRLGRYAATPYGTGEIEPALDEMLRDRIGEHDVREAVERLIDGDGLWFSAAYLTNIGDIYCVL